jgi:mRNA interferase MazF
VGSGAKQRPGLVLFDSGDQDLLVARVTTAEGKTDFDVAIENWKEAGLLAPSTVRIHKLATIEKNLVRRKLGWVSASDRERIIALLRERVF